MTWLAATPRTCAKFANLERRNRLAIVGVVLLSIAANSVATDAAPPDFEREILPILRRSCFECHGPKVQEGDLRLDDRQAVLSHGSAIVAGDPAGSEIVRRVTLPPGNDEFMPATGKPLTTSEIELIRRWIDAGAVWPENVDAGKHWAYVPPTRPELAPVKNAAWVKNGVDHFVLSRLEHEGLAPSLEADRATLLRRAYLDLIGLPPTPDEVDAFLADDSPQAYENVVDRLLESPHFGERWARPWLDLARYADSHGYQRDDLREIWAYRDWVIRAINADMPFDQFTIEQLAGDLLPGATVDQKIATGFNRCTMTNVEAGTDPEETRTNQVIDRVNTTATIWLGSTIECAQCHDHKYDPFSQKEYYQLFAFFNNTAIEAERSNPKVPGSIQFIGPSMRLPDATGEAKQQLLEVELAAIEKQLAQRARELRREVGAWERQMHADPKDAPQSLVLELSEFDSTEGAAHEVLDDKSVLLVDETPDTDAYTFTVSTELTGITAIKLEALTDDSLPGGGPGRGDAGRPNFVLTTFAVEAAPAGSSNFEAVRFSKASSDYAQPRFDAGGAIDDDPDTGWAISPQFFKPHWAQFQTQQPLGFEAGTTIRFRLVQDYGGGRTIGRLRISAITGNPVGPPVPAEIARIVLAPPKDRSAAERRKLNRYRADQDQQSAALRNARAEIETKLKAAVASTTLVMQELPEARRTSVFDRGDFKQPTDPVEPGTPTVLHPYTATTGDRLALAQWLVDRRNPLAARVTVNRWWAEIFGHGIVETVEDFGIKGQPPTHPELLDWLAVEFMDNSWSMKKILRTMVTSATYRQSSNVSPELLARDDQNRLYARGPRVRMDAEMIRDNALAIAGLLSKKQFGPPIRPYQPDGLWVKVGGARVDYEVSPGEDRYRRGVYVVLKRGAPYPSFVTFDGSARLACTAKRSRSNTPLQALTLLNDPVYVEAAQALTERMLREQPIAGVDDRIRFMFRICVSREPSPRELAALRGLYDAQLESPRADQNRTESAAWYAVATVLLNLDETITKG